MTDESKPTEPPPELRASIEEAERGVAERARAELDELRADAHAESERAIRHLAPGGVGDLDGERRVIIDRGRRSVSVEEYRELVEPRGEEELLAAGDAVQRARDDVAALEVLDEIGTFEQLLIERAFLAGVNATLKRMRDAVGSAAATVHAEPLMRLSRPPALDARLRPPLPARATSLQAARLALRAAEAAREAGDPPASQRILDVRQTVDALEERLRRHHVAEDEGEAQDAEAELDLVDRLRGTIDDVERLARALRDAVEAA